MNIKDLIGFSAVALTFIGYVPYIRDVIKGTTKPHIYSWFLWGFVTLIAFALQLSDNAGPGAFVTLAASIMCIVVFFLSLSSGGQKQIKLIDTVFLVIALTALVLWIYAKQPVLSVILITLVDLLGFAPTIRKSWNSPHSETISFYTLNTIRFGLATVALNHYTIVSALYPIVWMFGNGLFALMLLLRRREIAKTV